MVFHQRERAANQRRSESGREREPVVISSEVMKDISPMRMVETSQAGLKDLGWKSEMERQRRVEGWKRPGELVSWLKRYGSEGSSCGGCFGGGLLENGLVRMGGEMGCDVPDGVCMRIAGGAKG